jgi:hypothetical protein
MTSHSSNYKGITMRSHLETRIAIALDEHEVMWMYEQPVTLPDGTSPYYLPDFTVIDAAEELELPRWIEVKPMEMIYDLANATGVYRKYGEWFDDEVAVAWESSTVKSLGSELWKPKRLAEYGIGDVLVTGAANATKRLSVIMRRNEIAFTRSQPFVNWAGFEKQRERQDRQARWAAESAERQREWEARRAEREREWQKAQAEREQYLVRFARVVVGMSPKKPRFESRCHVCDDMGECGSIFQLKFTNGIRWVRVCDRCYVSLPDRARS